MAKFCPFRKVPCLKENCELYYEDDVGNKSCAIMSITYNLEMLKRNLIDKA